MTPVVVLGAGRMIGQAMLARLVDHPWFNLVALGDLGVPAPDRPFEDTCQWRSCDPMPAPLRHLPHRVGNAAALGDLAEPDRLVLSVLPDGQSAETDRACATAGARVVTHAEDLRLATDVPLVIPELTECVPDAAMLATPNCTTVLLALALLPLRHVADIEAVTVTCLQSVSGADIPGPPAIEMLDSVCPHLRGEELALERETGRLFDNGFSVSAQAVRVPVRVGHTLLVSSKLSRPVDKEDILAAWRDYVVPERLRHLPSIVEQPICVADAADRPCPEPDAHAGGGMSITVGALRPCSVLDWRFVLVGNNMVRGSAGMSVLTAEWLLAG